jgi:hypothetical protein
LAVLAALADFTPLAPLAIITNDVENEGSLPRLPTAMVVRKKKVARLIFGRTKKTVREARAATIILWHGPIITRSVRNDASTV